MALDKSHNESVAKANQSLEQFQKYFDDTEELIDEYATIVRNRIQNLRTVNTEVLSLKHVLYSGVYAQDVVSLEQEINEYTKPICRVDWRENLSPSCLAIYKSDYYRDYRCDILFKSYLRVAFLDLNFGSKFSQYLISVCFIPSRLETSEME